MRATRLLLAAALAALAGCDRAPAPPPQPSISYKTRVENATARIEQTYRLSETEIVKVLIVPGWPMGERCVIYSGPSGSTMSCRELVPSRQ